jgi:hypothetical protein
LELPKWIWITQPLIALEQPDPFGVMATQNGPNLDYAQLGEKAAQLSRGLNCGAGSSLLKALVKAFERLHMVLAANSGYCGSK